MRKILFICLLVISNVYAKKYHEKSFLTSHNSYAAYEYGYLYAQQTLNIKHQLQMGVRGLMLDTYDIDGKVYLCHESKWLTEFITLDRDPQPLHEELVTIKKFLDKNPKAVITIILENYVSDSQLLDSTFDEAGLSDYVLKPSSWDPVLQNGWPELSWMRKQNKRLVIFNSISDTRLSFYEWRHVKENQYGTLDFNKALKERKKSQEYDAFVRYLYLVNYFPTFDINILDSYTLINTIFLRDFLPHAKKQFCDDHPPNFLALDFVELGDGMKLVNSNFVNSW